MEINKNWFYDFWLKNDSNIIIWDNLSICIFDDCKKSKKIFIWENTMVEYFLFWKVENDFFIDFYQIKQKSDLKIRNLFLSNKKNDFKNKINCEITSDFCKTDVLINWIIWNDWSIDLDSSIKVENWYKKNECILKQENIFLDEEWSFKWLPKLFINTEDIKASHSCSVSKIDKNLLYYLKSRWINNNKAKLLLVEAIFKKNFLNLKQFNKKKFEEVFLDFSNTLLELN